MDHLDLAELRNDSNKQTSSWNKHLLQVVLGGASFRRFNLSRQFGYDFQVVKSFHNLVVTANPPGLRMQPFSAH